MPGPAGPHGGAESVPALPRERWLHAALLVGPLALLYSISSQMLAADPDMFHEMAHFREALTSGWIPREDVFAYTPTVSPVIHHEWLTGAVLYFVAVTAGLGGAGLLVLRYLLMLGVAVGCYAVAKQRGAGTPLFALMSFVAVGMFGIGLSPVRAHAFSFVFLTVLLLLLEVDRRGGRWWPALWLPLYVLWLNMHGGFVVGLGLFGLYAAERFVRAWADGGTLRGAVRRTGHLAAVGGSMAALVIVNPYGWDFVPYLWNALRLERAAISEWAPLWAEGVEPVLRFLFAVSVLFALYAVARSKSVRRLPGFLLLLAAGWFALRHQRLLPIYAIVWLAYVPAYLQGTGFGAMIGHGWRRWARGLAVASVVLGGVWALRFVESRPLELRLPTTSDNNEIGMVYPAGVVDYLAGAGFSGNVMTPFEVGAFVSWKLHPAVRVSLDGRYEVAYPEGAVEESLVLYSGAPGWERVLERYPTDAVMVPRWSPTDSLMSRPEDGSRPSAWRLVYRDDGYSLFARGRAADRLPVTDRTGEPIPAAFP